MEIRDIMTHNVEIISADATIQEAARKMKNLDIGALPVSDKDRIVGMITDRDIVVRAISEGQNPLQTPVRDVMTVDIISCFEDEDLTQAIRIMEDNQVRRILVLSRDRTPVGIVSLGDIAVHAGNVELVEEVARYVSEPVHSR